VLSKQAPIGRISLGENSPNLVTVTVGFKMESFQVPDLARFWPFILKAKEGAFAAFTTTYKTGTVVG
jgi:hypothetical protein